MPEEQSWLAFYWQACGLRYGLLLPLSGLLSVVFTILLLARGRGAWLAPTMLIVVLGPLVLGMVGTVDGLIASMMVIYNSSVQPKPAELAQGKGMSLVTIQVGLMMMLPGYLLAAVGSTIRALRAPR
jgi:hypothetical protein